jgi:hypothetical protein
MSQDNKGRSKKVGDKMLLKKWPAGVGLKSLLNKNRGLAQN